jgi:hypothetical protein
MSRPAVLRMGFNGVLIWAPSRVGIHFFTAPCEFSDLLILNRPSIYYGFVD